MKPLKILKSTTILAAFAGLVLSISLFFAGDTEADKLNGIYVGIWVPSILALGCFMLALKDREW